MNTTCAVQPRILVADDQPDLIDALRLLLKREGIQIEAAASPEAALSAIGAGTFDLLLMDLNYTGDTTSGREGIDLLARVQALDGMLPIVVMTGWGSVDLAVEAMRRGVRNFVQKPWDNGSWSPSCAPKSRPAARAASERELERRELDEARRIQRKLLPSTMPQIEGGRSRSRGSRRQASAATASTRSPSDRAALGALDRRRRRQRHSRGAADVEPAGGGARLCDRRDAAGRALPAGQPHPVRPHRRRPVHLLLLLHRRHDDLGTLTFSNAGHYAPILVRANGDVERLDRRRRCSASSRTAATSRDAWRVGSGDRLVLFTDGITEARNADDEEFGEDASDRVSRSQSRLQRARAPGAARAGGRGVHRRPLSGRCDVDCDGCRISEVLGRNSFLRDERRSAA